MMQKTDIYHSMNFTIGNVVSNSIADHYNWTGPGRYGGDPGLDLIVKGGIPSDSYVDIAQLDSVRTDMLWGSYRASMKLPSINGTCSAFFWVCKLAISLLYLLILPLVFQRQPRNRHGISLPTVRFRQKDFSRQFGPTNSKICVTRLQRKRSQ